MANEKERVLEMVADGTITAAEGVKLLEALGSVAGGPDHNRAPRRKRATHTRSMLNEIGPMIQATMGDVFKGRKSFDAYENIDFEKVKSLSEEIEEGRDLVIHGDVDRGKSISILLSRSEDATLKASLNNDADIEVGTKDNKRILIWRSGELSVEIPDSLASVNVFSKGGGISSTNVSVPIELKTMGGGIEIVKPGNRFSIKTMGGGLDITIDKSWHGNSKAKTMGGGISIHLVDDVPVLVNATTLGGSIDVGGNNPQILSESGHGHAKSKVTVLYGDEDEASNLAVTSMGGGIEIEGEADE